MGERGGLNNAATNRPAANGTAGDTPEEAAAVHDVDNHAALGLERMGEKPRRREADDLDGVLHLGQRSRAPVEHV